MDVVHQAAQVPRCFWLYPAKVGYCGNRQLVGLYAVGFADGRIKFGKAQRPRGRVIQHWRDAKGEILWSHYFGAVLEGRWPETQCRAEVEAIRMADEVGRRIGRSESFTGLTKRQALAIARCARAADLLLQRAARGG